jgi:hypothetical protein
MARRNRMLGTLVLVSVLTVLIAGSVASAHDADDGQIHGCYEKKTGRLRIADDPRCSDDEWRVSFSAQ